MRVAVVLNTPEKIALVTEKTVIYADGGYAKHGLDDGKNVTVVGDFDSLGYTPNSESTVKLDCEKNFTDGEFAVRTAVKQGADEIVIYGALGGRIDHIICNLALLKIAKNLGVKAHIKEKDLKIYLLDGESKFSAKKGVSVSVLPYGDSAVVERSTGLYYPLENLTITNADTRGISNIATEREFTLSVTNGQCLVIVYN